MEFQHDGMQT